MEPDIFSWVLVAVLVTQNQSGCVYLKLVLIHKLSSYEKYQCILVLFKAEDGGSLEDLSLRDIVKAGDNFGYGRNNKKKHTGLCLSWLFVNEISNVNRYAQSFTFPSLLCGYSCSRRLTAPFEVCQPKCSSSCLGEDIHSILWGLESLTVLYAITRWSWIAEKVMLVYEY